jgi:hypothetical protein
LDVSPFKVAVPTAGLLLVLGAGVLWFMYMANGIAYGSIVGLHGTEADLRTLGVRAETSLAAAVVVQAIGVGLVVSVFTARLPSVAESRDLIVAAHQELTIEWWTSHRERFDLYISDLVLIESARRDRQAAANRLVELQGRHHTAFH